MSGSKIGVPDKGAAPGCACDCPSQDRIDDMNDVPKLEAKAQELIGRQLKVLYGSILDEPVPDQFVKLLEDLERKERGA